MKKCKGLCFLLLAIATSLLGCSVNYNDEGTIANESYYESIEVVDNKLFAINLSSGNVESRDLLNGEVIVFDGGGIKKNNNKATDYSVFEDRVYVYNSVIKLLDEFNINGTYIKTISTPIRAHEYLLAVGKGEFVSLSAWRMRQLDGRPRGMDICLFNEEKIILVKDLPLSEELDDLPMTILLKHYLKDDIINIVFPNAPYVLQMSKDLKKHRLIEWKFPNLVKAFEIQTGQASSASNPGRLQRAFIWRKELISGHHLILEYSDRGYFFKLLSKKLDYLDWSKDVLKTREERPFSVWETEEETVVFYALYESKGINYFKLDKNILK